VQPGGDGGIAAEVSRAHDAARVFGVLDQVQHPSSRTAAGCPKSSTSAARRKITP
jgi:hypothetical protein